MRLVRVFAVIGVVGCGGERDANSKPVPPAEPIARLDLPRLDDARRVVLLDKARPAALVWVGARGQLAVGKVATGWRGDIAGKDRTETEVGKLREHVLRAIVAGAGAAAPSAQVELAGDTDAALIQRGRAGMLFDGLRAEPPQRGRLPAAPVTTLGKLDPTAPLVIAAPSAPATAVVRVLRRTGGAIAVDHAGKLAVLDAAFAIEAWPPAGSAPWLELYADAAGVHLVLQPDDREKLVEWRGTGIDLAGLGNAYTTLGDRLHVDVIARDDTTAQTLVDLLAAAAAAGMARLGVVEGPATREERKTQIQLALRDLQGHGTVDPGQPNAQGDLDKAIIRDVIRLHLPEIRVCYERMLATQPHLAGTVATQFFIGPDGKVVTAQASGVDPELASCVADALRAIEFPRPRGGGGVQVNYPFRFATP
jgi:hypothetical protein